MDVKKRNTWIFVILATLFNIVLTLVLLIAGFIGVVLLRKAVGVDKMNPNMYSLLVILDIIMAIVLSRVIYSAILKLINKKVDFDAHFDPIFKPRGKLK